MGLFKKVEVPSGDKKEITAYEKWAVRWIGTTGYYSGNAREECEFFTSQEDAEHFADQLREAFKLTRTCGEKSVLLKKE